MIDPAVTSEPKNKWLSKITGASVFTAVFLAGLIILFYVVPLLTRNDATVGVSGANEALQARVESLDARLHALETRVDGLNAAAANPQASRASDEERDEGDAKLQSDFAALSSAMTALQAEVKATGTADADARTASAAGIAAVAAYARLDEAAASGVAFADELAAMRDVAKNDNALLGLVAKLEPFQGGVPTLTALGEELMQHHSAVAVAVAKGEAQNWWQRVVAELQGLITVRPLHGGESDALAGLETALAKSNSTAAMDALKALPPDAQQSLGDWKKELEARQSVDEDLKDMAVHFTAMPPAKNP